MSTTEEGQVKKDIKKVLAEFGPLVYTFMPVQAGYGAPGLDFHCHIGKPDHQDLAIAFYIEAKAPGKKPTPRQLNTKDDMEDSGAKVFVIDGPEGLKELRKWLQRMRTIIESIHASML